MDPFSGSSTTGIAANLCGRRFCGLEQEIPFCEMSVNRRKELENTQRFGFLQNHIADLRKASSETMIGYVQEDASDYGTLPFE